ncbi:MAG TPA: threonine/serine dehydratase, partial [Thermomicrobiales bacterium]|nr:threonine/serine dehydratase [Thermomicrobiales bacterium]
MSVAEIPAAPTLADVLLARRVVNRYLAPTPVLRPEGLARELGFEVILKCENLQPVGAFKVRGGMYLMSRLDDDERTRGVVTASTGNHAQSIAYAAREFGVRAVIFMPENPNPVKLASTKALGAQVIEFGRDFDECRIEAGEYAAREGMRFIHSANEPDLIAGVGTYALELIEEAPDLDVVIVPVGGGSGVCGTALVFKSMRPETLVIAVQSEGMPVVYRSFHERQLLSLEGGSTWAEGLATRVAFELPYAM